MNSSLHYLHLTEERVSKSDRHRLSLRVVLQRGLTELSSETALLVAAEWHLVVEGVVGVDPDGAGLERIADLDGGVEVLGVHGGGEAVGGLVGGLDDLVLGGELGDGADGAEDLLLHDLHVLVHVGEDGGLDEVALVALAVAASLDGGTSLLSGLDIADVDVSASSICQEEVINNLPHDAVELQLGDLWALEGVLGEWVANNVLLCALLEALQELIVDTVLYVDTRTGAAALAVVKEDTEVDPGDGVVDVSVVEDNVWRLAAELKGDLLQVGAGGGLENGTAGNGGASEGDLVDVHVRGDGGTGGLTETRDDVDNTWWETGLLDELGGDEGTKWGLLSRLDDNGVTASNGWANLPCPHEEREAERDC